MKTAARPAAKPRKKRGPKEILARTRRRLERLRADYGDDPRIARAVEVAERALAATERKYGILAPAADAADLKVDVEVEAPSPSMVGPERAAPGHPRLLGRSRR